LKILVPLAAGSIVAFIVGTLVGMAMGLTASHSLFFIVAPMMAGGLGEGAIPLSVGYSLILHQPQDTLFAQIIPVVMLASFTAVLLCGLLTCWENIVQISRARGNCSRVQIMCDQK
jgi:Na+/citrate or Na+/malate symporter